ncbi:MAG: hypothetical protein RRY79_00490 [Clostridia bacterium]
MIFKYCVKCGRKIEGTLKFCIFCGSPIEDRKISDEECVERITLDSLIKETGSGKYIGDGKFDIDTADFSELAKIGAVRTEGKSFASALENDTEPEEPVAEPIAASEEPVAEPIAEPEEPVAEPIAASEEPVAEEESKETSEEPKVDEKAKEDKAEIDTDQYNFVCFDEASNDEGEFDADGKKVTTTGFFFLQLLFFIPIVGLIAAIIMSFSKKNQVLRTYAKSRIIWGIAIIAILIVFAVIFDLVLKPMLIAQGIQGLNLWGLVIKFSDINLFGWLTALFN